MGSTILLTFLRLPLSGLVEVGVSEAFWGFESTIGEVVSALPFSVTFGESLLLGVLLLVPFEPQPATFSSELVVMRFSLFLEEDEPVSVSSLINLESDVDELIPSSELW